MQEELLTVGIFFRKTFFLYLRVAGVFRTHHAPHFPLAHTTKDLDHSALFEPTEALGVQDSINSVLSGLGIDPSLCQGSEVCGRGEGPESGGYVNAERQLGEDRQERGEAVAPATVTALKAVRGLLKRALMLVTTVYFAIC